MEEAKGLENADEVLEIPISYEERGKKIGKEIGREEKEREIVLKMLREGFDIEMIMKFTEMKKAEVEQLRKQL